MLMNAATTTQTLLFARAHELMERGHFARAAEKLEAAVALSEQSAPPDCLIVVTLRLDLCRALSAYMRTAGVSNAVINECCERIFRKELPLVATVLEKRHAADSLMPGRCRPAETEWF